MRRTRAVWAAAVGVVALAGMTGCTHTHGGAGGLGTSATTARVTASSSPTPSLDAQNAAEAANKAAAISAYQHYFDVTQEVEQRPGMTGWEDEVLPLLGGDFLTYMTNFYTQAQEQGLRATAPEMLVSSTPVDYSSDPSGAGHEQVVLEVCIDATGSDLVLPDGSLDSTSSRGISIVTMQHQNGQWTVDKSEDKEDETC